MIFSYKYTLLMEKAMAPHSSTPAWKIPWMEQPGRLQSMGSLRVGHDWATSLSLFTFMHRRRKWQLTPAFLPGESQGWGSLMGCRLWGCTESDMTEATQQQQQPLGYGKTEKITPVITTSPSCQLTDIRDFLPFRFWRSKLPVVRWLMERAM